MFISATNITHSIGALLFVLAIDRLDPGQTDKTLPRFHPDKAHTLRIAAHNGDVINPGAYQRPV